jgi:hypothetical protein
MYPVYDKNDIQIHEIDYEQGGPLWMLQRDGFTQYFVYDFRSQCYIERECRQPEVTLTTD